MHKQKQQAGEQGEKHTEEREARKLRKKKKERFTPLKWDRVSLFYVQMIFAAFQTNENDFTKMAFQVKHTYIHLYILRKQVQ